MNAQGPFEVSMNAEPPYETVDSVSLSRASFDKRFTGPLEARSQVHMLAVRTAHEGSGAYVATERIVGTLDGKAGSFTVVHIGQMNRGAQTLTITIVPDSGTGALAGISGHLEIRVVDRQHFYTLEYSFE